MNQSHVRILGPGPELPGIVECESGDTVQVDASSECVFLVLDDVDDTALPTARLTPYEARLLAAALVAASLRAGVRD